MGCNCGGSKKAAGALGAAGTPLRGPQAPGYAWAGPRKRAEAAAKTKTK